MNRNQTGRAHIYLHLSLIEKIGPGTVLRLIKALETACLPLAALYLMKAAEFKEFAGLDAERAHALQAGLADTKLLEQELSLLEKYAITLISLSDEQYPSLLKNIHLPPLVLYVKGAAQLSSDKHLAVVGSRASDAYGALLVNSFIPELVHNGWSIVSGGALGIDGLAHGATLGAGGTTIAVLGSGLLKPYPAAHKGLFKKIIEQGGALVSSFPLRMEAKPGLFPARNRIIAGLSRGCLVMQARIPSGALITAQCAVDEGREVFAVPGSVDNPLSAGCHRLISQGATLVTAASDILESFGIMPKPVIKNVPQLTVHEKLLYLCAQPQSLNELLEQSALEEPVLRDALCELALAGKITQNKVGLWARALN